MMWTPFLIGLAFTSLAEAAFDINMTVDGSNVVDVGQFRGVNVAYSWSSLTQNLSNGQIVIDLPATLDTNSTSDVQVYGSAHTTSAVYTPATRKVIFTFVNPLPAGSSGTVQFFVRFPTNAADGTLAPINGTSSGTGQPNGTSSVTLEANAVPMATNLQISKWANIYPMLGQDVTYTIAVGNYGNTNFLNPVVVDQLPAGTVYVSSNPSGTYNAGSNTVQWTNSTLTPGNTHYYNVTVRYDSPTFSVGQWVNNVATATGTDSLSAPVNLTTNTSVQIVAANPAAGFNKWDSAEPASLRGNFQYYFWVVNQGNVPLTNYTFTDDLPKEFIPNYIYPGSDDNGNFSSTINIWYKTTANSSWRLLPGSPFITAPGADPGVPVDSLGLVPGEVISSVKYEFASVPVGYDADWRPRLVGTMGNPVTGLDRLGASITPLPKTISNTYNVTYVHSGTTYTGSDTETTEIMGVSPMPTFSIYDADPSSYIPLQEIKWTWRMENDWGGSEPLINPVYGTLLPASLEYVPGSVLVTEGPLPTPAVTVTNNYNGTGRQLVKFSFAGNHPVAWTEISGMWDDWAVYMDFKTRVKAGAPAGAGEVEYHLLSSGNLLVNGDLAQTTRTDTNDLDGDANTTENLLTSNGGDFSISNSTAIDSVLWVKGQLDADFNRFPDAGFSLPGGTMQYKLIVTNPGNIPLTGIRVMDILPHVGDVGVVLYSQTRGSDFGLALTSTVTAAPGITVKYSTATNPVRTDLDATLSSPAGAVSGSFSTTPPAPLSNTKSLLFDFGALVLNPGESKEIIWSMSIPAVITSGQVAWNSIGQRSQSSTTGSPLPPSEPIKVGIAAPLSVGSQVWNDLDNDGVYDAGEPGIPGVTLQIFKSNGSPALDPLGNVVPSTTTNTNGVYAFTALADGDYFVRVTPPLVYIPSGAQTADPDNDSDTDSNIDLARSPPVGSYESGVFTFATNTEPTVEPSPGGTQDDVDDNNGNMTVDFGFVWNCPTIDICPQVTFLPTATQGSAYNFSVQTIGGTAPYAYTTSGALPSGLTLSPSGVLSGTPTTLESRTFAITSTDSIGCNSTRSYTINVVAAGSILQVVGGSSTLNVPITGAQFSVNGTPATQSVEASGVATNTDNPVLLTSLTINDAGTSKTLSVGNLNGSTVSQVSLSPSEGAFGVVLNGATTNIATSGLPAFQTSAAAVATNTNLNHYIYDDRGEGEPDLTGEYDVVFNYAFTPGDYIVIQERNGNSHVQLQPLDASGNVIAGTRTVQVRGEHDWNTGYAAASYSSSQPYYLTAIRHTLFGTSQPIFGFRLSVAGADCKFFGLSDSPFSDNPTSYGFIGDRVWNDIDKDGIQDAGETGLQGITVKLLRSSNLSVLATTVTNATGNYGFSNVTAGTYVLEFVLPSGYMYSPKDAGSSDLTDSDATTATGRTSPFTLSACDSISYLDAGMSLICNTISLQSIGSTTVGTSYSSSVAASGDVSPYTYAVTAGALPTWASLNPNTGAITGNSNSTSSSSFTITATASSGCTGSRSYTLQPVCPTLTLTPAPGALAQATVGVSYSQSFVSTGSTGTLNWSVSSGTLPPGLSINSSTGTISGIPTTPTVGPSGVSITIRAQDNFGCSVSQNYTLRVVGLSIGNAVWLDTNNNGIKNSLEPGISGVTVQLFRPGNDNAIGGSGGNADSQVGSDWVTDSTGAYLFDGLAPGKYFVKVTPPSGHITSGTPVTSDNNANNNNDGAQPGGLGNPIFSPIIDLAVGAESTTDGDTDSNTNLTVDFGLFPGIQVGNLVWIDSNNNGTKDVAETGISGLTVELLNGAGPTVLATTTTNASGNYGFTVYTAGSYRVRVTPNTTYPLASTSQATTDNGVDNNNDGSQPGNRGAVATSPSFTLTAGGEPGSGGSTNTEDTIDFGFRGCPTISNTPASLTSGNVGAPYSATISSSGGVGPYTYAITSGSLPSGLALDTNGTVSGTTSTGGSFVITVRATDSLGCTGSTAITVPISNTPTHDYGDFNSFPLASSLASASLRMGALSDADASAPLNPAASGDDLNNTDDEDGIAFPINVVPTYQGRIVVKVTNTTGSPAHLNAWLDFDRDGDPLDAGEQIATNVPIASGRTNSNETITFTTPANASVGFAVVRLRLTSIASPTPSGPVGIGEVEDYPVNICPTLGYAYGTQGSTLYEIEVATGIVRPASNLPSGFSRSNGAAFAQYMGADGVVFYTTGTAELKLGAWDRATGVNNVAGDLGTFGVPNGSHIYSGDYYNGFYYFVINGTDDLWKAVITGTSGNYAISSATKVSDMWSNSRSHGYGDIVITPGGIMYAHASRDGGGPEFFTVDLNVATPTATQLGTPAYMHNGITFGLDGTLFGGLGVSAVNADWFTVSLTDGSSTFVKSTVVSGMSDMTMGSCNQAPHLIINDPWANKDFGDFSLFSAASSTVNTSIRLGEQVDSETTIGYDGNATHDDTTGVDDEDGITFSQLVQGQVGTVTIHRTNTSGSSAFLSAWVDFDNDGLLDGANEQIISNVSLPTGTSGNLAYTFNIPVGAVLGNVGARFRISSSINPTSTGDAGSGEVEDHLANIEPFVSIGNLVWHDANNNGTKDASESGLSGANVQLFRVGTDNLVNTADDVQVGATQTTTSTGSYLFSVLPPGRYFVKVTPPSGYLTSGLPATTDNNVNNNNDGTQPGGPGTVIFSPAIQLTVNSESVTDGDTDPNTNLTVDFGLYPGIQLGNLVWHDANDNGTKDTLEVGIEGLLVELLNASNNAVITSTLTNSLGQYGFTVYSNGNYKVRVTPSPSLPLASTSFATSDNGLDNDNNGQQPGAKNTYSTSNTFALAPMTEPGSSGSTNTEHTLDFGFRPCPTVTVTSSPAQINLAVQKRPYTQAFLAAGGIAPHTFVISGGALPGGLTLSSGGVITGTPNVHGTFNAVVQASDVKGCTGQLAFQIEVLPPLSIGNLVFMDSNGNGRADSAEGVQNVTVELYASNQPPLVGAALATTTTDASGRYIFEGLFPGNYIVHIPPSMFLTGAPLESTLSVGEGLSGDDDVGENGINQTFPALTGISSSNVILAVGTAPTDTNGETGIDAASDNLYDASIDLTVDFGFSNPVGVGNLVFHDSNRNGHYDAGEGVPGVLVEIYQAGQIPGQNGGALAQQITDLDGHYFFDFLSPGSYFIYLPPDNFNVQGAPLEGLTSIPGFGTTNGDDDTNENGLDGLSPNLDGTRSSVFILANNGSPTDATGESGFLKIEDNRDDNNYNLTIDFGFRASDPDEVGVGNFVFMDANGDLTASPDEGVDGVTVHLYASGEEPGSPSFIATTTTVDGRYLFSGLAPGTYFIHVPASMFASGAPMHGMTSLPGQGGDDGVDDHQDENGGDASNPEVAGVTTLDFTLSPGAEPTTSSGGFSDSEMGYQSLMDEGADSNVDLTIDLGFHRSVAIGNLVYVDTNRDGHFSTGEGRAGVTVELYLDTQSPGFEAPLFTTVTASDGTYSFAGLNSGSYIVYIPGEMFSQSGPLSGLQSLIGQGTDGTLDDDVDENGADSEYPWVEGARSSPVGLLPSYQPIDSGTETGYAASSDNSMDSDSNFTIDFGFYAPLESSFVAWQTINDLNGLNAPTDDPDGDGLLNVLEYTLGLDPASGVIQSTPLRLQQNPSTGQIDAIVTTASDLQDVTLTLEYIGELSQSPAGWAELSVPIVDVTPTPNGLTVHSYRSIDLGLPNSIVRGFIRLKVSLDQDFNGTPEAEARSEVWGWSRSTFPVQTATFSNPFLKSAVFTGKVDAVIGNALEVGTAVGVADVQGVMTGTIPYYVEVTSGPHAGHRFEVDVVNSSRTQIAIDLSNPLSTLSTLPSTLAEAKIILLPHWTLSESLPPSDFRATNNQATADRAIQYNGVAFVNTWLYLNKGNPKWVSNAALTDQGGRVMNPTEAYLVQTRAVTQDVLNVGIVRTHSFATPLKLGNQLIAGGWPMDQSPSSRLLTVANGYTGANSASRADRIMIWNGDATSGTTGYVSHYLLKTATLEKWVRSGDAQLASENNLPLFKAMRGVYFNAYIAKPNVVSPCPWTP